MRVGVANETGRDEGERERRMTWGDVNEMGRGERDRER